MIPQIFPVACHTDVVGEGSTFVVIRGMQDDGVRYIGIALERGARTIVLEDEVMLTDSIQSQIQAYGARVQRVANARHALAELSAEALGYPARKLKIIAVTGTKGKTTTSFLLEHILRISGYRTALISTVHNRILDTILPTSLTTPQPDYIQVFLDQCVKAGVEWVVMEVAAQAFSLYRVHDLVFETAVFTNFSLEHTEFYSSLDDYFAAKCQIIDHIRCGAPLVINADDPRVSALAQQTNTVTASLTADATVQVRCLKSGLEGISGMLCYAQHWYSVQVSTLMGAFNLMNVAMACLAAQVVGVSFAESTGAVTNLAPIPGRLACYPLPNGARAFIDYAHTISSYEAVLGLLRGMTDHLVVVFGAGGDRGADRRPLLGASVAQYADYAVVTSDNPRSEEVSAIIADIMVGIPPESRQHFAIEQDRERAIRLAYEQSRAGSIIVLLGKGPDEYQLIKGVKTFFSERAILQNLM